MIGQLRNIELIDTCVRNNNFPHFCIIEGAEGSGKRTLLSYIANKLNTEIIFFENKVDGVRELIETCYSQVKPLIYCIINCQQCSVTAQNAMLKIVEEPPKNAYIILCSNSHTLLPTIYSRAWLIKMEQYTNEELTRFSIQNHINDLALKYGTTCGELLMLDKLNLQDLENLCTNIVDKASQCNVTSILKIGQKFQLKDGVEGINVRVFLLVLSTVIFNRIKGNTLSLDNTKQLYSWYQSIHECQHQLDLGYNPQYIIETLLLSFRV
jgi:hypothetical protein